MSSGPSTSARLSAVMLNATLDRTDAAAPGGAHRAGRGRRPVGHGRRGDAVEAARGLVLDRDGQRLGGRFPVAGAGERPPGARPDHHRDLGAAEPALSAGHRRAGRGGVRARTRPSFLHEIIADLHLFKGAADATMSHGEGWRFMLTGVYLERAQLIARLLGVCFGDGAERRSLNDHLAQMSVLRMACALEPYLRVYTAEMQPAHPRIPAVRQGVPPLDPLFHRPDRGAPDPALAAAESCGRGDPAAPGRPAQRAAGVTPTSRRSRPPAPAPSWPRWRPECAAHPPGDVRDLRRLSARTAAAGLMHALEIRHVTQYHYDEPGARKRHGAVDAAARGAAASGWSASTSTSIRRRRLFSYADTSATPSATSTCPSRTGR